VLERRRRGWWQKKEWGQRGGGCAKCDDAVQLTSCSCSCTVKSHSSERETLNCDVQLISI